MRRRQALTLIGTSLGALTGAGLYGRHEFLAPSPSDPLDNVPDLAVRLFGSLSPTLREKACVDYEHPMRQYHNRGVRGGGVRIGGGDFSREQRGMLTDLLYAGLSEEGRGRLPEEFFIYWPGVHWMNLLICGDPTRPPYQIILSGPHLNLRLGGRSREGVAFGGPQVYGDQRGNYKQGLPRNIYRYQFQIAHRLFRSLEPGQRRSALEARAPIQTQVELQGRDGSFPGVAVSSLASGSRAIVTELIDGILSTYHPEEVSYAWKCLEENGGIESLFLSYYEDGEVDGSGEYQIFRLEGPAAVFYFRGYPHVHAFVNIAMNGDAPLSVGGILGENPAPLEGRQVKGLFEDAMMESAGTDFAYYEADSVVGRLRTGLIREGDIYNLESWQDSITIVEMKGSRIGGSLLAQLRVLGTEPAPDRLYTVATTTQVATETAREALGTIESSRQGLLLRDATIACLKKRWAAGSGRAS